nr:MAG TPA: hypothetical protein [Caudoviricetes sp.]
MERFKIEPNGRTFLWYRILILCDSLIPPY